MRFICALPADDDKGRKDDEFPLRQKYLTKTIIHTIPDATSLFIFKPTNE